MKKTLFAASALLVLSTAAFADDIPSVTYPEGDELLAVQTLMERDNTVHLALTESQNGVRCQQYVDGVSEKGGQITVSTTTVCGDLLSLQNVAVGNGLFVQLATWRANNMTCTGYLRDIAHGDDGFTANSSAFCQNAL